MPFTTAALFVKTGTPADYPPLLQASELIEAHGMRCVFVTPEEERMNGITYPWPRADIASLPADKTLALVLGGDGSFLNAARYLYGTTIPILGINLGRIGFLTEIPQTDVRQKLEKVLNGVYNSEKRPYFMAQILDKNGAVLMEESFFNDAAFNRHPQDKMITYRVNVEEAFVSERRADGLVVSTPTGSTAYNLSGGGPIVYPSLDALVITPIAPQTLSFRPVVIPTERALSITLISACAYVSLDGRQGSEMVQGQTLRISKSPHSLDIIHSDARNFFDLLRQKLGWDKD